jgi:adenosylmethionine-8-amino-7-oxononanoate aminotransferase
MANLDIIEREDLLSAAARLEKALHEKLAGVVEHPAVAEVRSGMGAVAAVQLNDAGAALGLAKALRSHGVATRAVGAGGIQISPAFVITDEQVDELVAAIHAALG